MNEMAKRKCRRCGSPNMPLFSVRASNIDVFDFDCLCLDCGFTWSEVLTADEYHGIVADYEAEFRVAVKNRNR